MGLGSNSNIRMGGYCSRYRSMVEVTINEQIYRLGIKCSVLHTHYFCAYVWIVTSNSMDSRFNEGLRPIYFQGGVIWTCLNLFQRTQEYQ